MTGLRLAPVAAAPEISVIVPVHNEAGNIAADHADVAVDDPLGARGGALGHHRIVRGGPGRRRLAHELVQ